MQTSTRFIDNPEAVGLRFVGYADDLRRLDHKGWYTDSEFQDDTLRGVVYQLPAKHGRARLVAGYQESVSDGIVLDLSTLDYAEKGVSDLRDDHTVRDLAGTADELARIAAEQERDYQDAYRAGSDAATADNDYRTARKTFRDIVHALRLLKTADVTLPAVVTQALQDRLDTLRDDYQDARTKRDRLIQDAPTWSKEIKEAWREGWSAESPLDRLARVKG